MQAEMRLATYGSLAPGNPNHEQVSVIPGRWSEGTVRGSLQNAGWGAKLGFPGLVLDDQGDSIPVHLLESQELPGHWERLDAFGGSGFRRVSVTVDTLDGPRDACIYVLAG